MLAQSTSPGYNGAVEFGKQKTKDDMDEMKVRVNMLVTALSIIFFARSRDIIMIMVNTALLVASLILKEPTTIQLISIVISPIRMLQKLVFLVGVILDRLLIDKAKDDNVTTAFLKMIKYGMMSFFLLGTL
jgi:hypothetical protein